LTALNSYLPYLPHFFHSLTLRTDRGAMRKRLAGDATYTHQLRAFAAPIRGGASMPTDPADAGNRRIIDANYRTAGLKLRGT
jgi:hypothetical protein